MKKTLLNLICTVALLTPLAALAQDDHYTIDDFIGTLRESQRESQNGGSRDITTEDVPTNEDSEYDDGTPETDERAFTFALNHADGAYAKDEQFVLKIQANTDGFLYVFNITPDGQSVIFPNRNTSQNSIRAGETRQIPDGFSGFKWRFTGEFKNEKIAVALSKVELDKETMLRVCENCKNLLRGSSNYSNRKKIEIDDLPNVWFSWVNLNLKDSTDPAPDDDNGDDNNGARRIAFFFAPTNYIDSKTGESKFHNLVGPTIGSCIRTIRAAKDFGKFDEVRLFSGPELSEEKVYDAFKLLKEKTGPGDEIFIYWLGHGIEWPPCDTERDGTHESLILSTIVGESNDEGEPTGVVDPKDETTIQDDELADLLAQLPGRKIVLLLQTCFSGGMLEAKALDSRKLQNMGLAVKSLDDAIMEYVDQPYDYDEFLQYVPKIMDFSDVKSVSHRRPSLAEVMNNLDSGVNDRLTKTFVDSLLKQVRAKDISRNAPDMAVIATSMENQTSRAYVVDGEDAVATSCGEGKLPICPLDFALLTVLTDKTGKYAKTPGKADMDDLWNVAKEFIPVNAARLGNVLGEEISQKPVYMNNIGKASLAP